MLEACGLKGHRSGGAQISPKHANFIENADERHDRRRRGPDGRGAPSRERAVRCPRSEHEVEFLGELDCPSCRKVRTGAENRRMPARARLARSIARVDVPRAAVASDVARVASAGVARPHRSDAAVARGRLRSARRCARRVSRRTRDAALRDRPDRGARRLAERRRPRSPGARASRRESLSSGSTARLCCRRWTRSRRSGARPTTEPSRTRCASRSSPERPAAVLRRGPDSWLVSMRGRVMEPSSGHRRPEVAASLDLDAHGGAHRCGGHGGRRGHRRARRRARGSFRSPRRLRLLHGGALVFRLRSGLELLLGNGGDIKLKVAVAERVLAMLPAGSTFLDVSTPGRPVSGYGSPPSFAPPSSSGG